MLQWQSHLRLWVPWDPKAFNFNLIIIIFCCFPTHVSHGTLKEKKRKISSLLLIQVTTWYPQKNFNDTPNMNCLSPLLLCCNMVEKLKEFSRMNSNLAIQSLSYKLKKKTVHMTIRVGFIIIILLLLLLFFQNSTRLKCSFFLAVVNPYRYPHHCIFTTSLLQWWSQDLVHGRQD
jgi:uncharacterized integral membrane protein